MREIVVIGAGAAGLRAALTLCEKGRERGVRVTVLEAGAQVGGRIGSERHGEWRVERGPATVQEGSPGLLPLIEHLGLSGAAVTSDERADRRYLYLDGRLQAVPAKPPALLTSPILPFSAKLRLLREPFVKRAAEGGPDESISAFVSRRLGPQVAERVVDAVMGGIYAGDIGQLSAKSALSRVVDMERKHGSLLRAAMAMGKESKARKRAGDAPASRRLLGFREGLAQLAVALLAKVEAAGGRVLVSTPARALSREGRGWLVRTDGGVLLADAVLLCVPPPAAQALLRPVDAVLADAYAGIPMAPIAAVCLGYQRAEVPHPLDGFGFLVPRREGLRVLGVLFMSSILPKSPQAPEGHVLLRAMYGGAHDLHVLDQDDQALVTQARADLAKTLGIDAAAVPRFQHVQRWAQAIEQYVLGHGERVATIEGRSGGTGLHFAGAALHGISVPDVLRDGEAAALKLLG